MGNAAQKETMSLGHDLAVGDEAGDLEDDLGDAAFGEEESKRPPAAAVDLRARSAQEREGGPVLDTLLSFAGRIGNHQLAGEIDDVVEKVGVFAGEVVRPFEGIAGGKQSVFVHPFFDVGALALDEMAGQFAALGLGRVGKIERFEFGFE